MTSYGPVSSSLEIVVKESTVVGKITTAEEEKEKGLKATSLTIGEDHNSVESILLLFPNNNHHHQQQQHGHHLSSNAAVFFFLGSLLYFAIDIWDLPDDDDDEDEDYDYDDYDDDDDMVTIQLFNTTATLTLSPYYIVTSLAALCYVIDATLSITEQFREYSHRPEGSSSFLSCWNVSSSSSPSPPTTTVTVNQNETTTPPKLSNTSTITRNVVIELILAITFGVGAILEFSSNAFFEDATRSQWIMTYLSVHSYLLHAIVLIIFTYLMTKTTTTTTNFWSGGRKKGCFAIVYSWITLEAVGDLFFVIGSIIDVILVYKFRIPKQQQTPMIFDESEVAAMAYGEVCSSTMWLIDSILYLIVDFYDCDDDSSSSEESMSNDDDDVCGYVEMAAVSPLIDKHDDGDDEEEDNNTSQRTKK